jgi:RimJ/RimL family protein N-acetyltransferase
LLSQEITDGVIVLRPFRLDDTNQLYEAVRESLVELKPWMSWAHDGYAIHDAKEFIQITRARWDERTLFAFAMIDPTDGSVLGGCSLSHLHPVYHLCNLGYWVRTGRRGEGIAGRATILAARFAFEQVGLIRVEIVVAMENKASTRVAEKVGAHYEGVLRNRMVAGRDIYDAHMYSLTPQDFGLIASL